jgi:hypothetical protein
MRGALLAIHESGRNRTILFDPGTQPISRGREKSFNGEECVVAVIEKMGRKDFHKR